LTQLAEQLENTGKRAKVYVSEMVKSLGDFEKRLEVDETLFEEIV
jgi:hypothetical protein